MTLARDIDTRDFDDRAQQRRHARMAAVDAMTMPLRALVHEHGLTIVKAFLDCGVSNPKHIAHLIATVRQGSTEIGNRNHAPNQMGNLSLEPRRPNQ